MSNLEAVRMLIRAMGRALDLDEALRAGALAILDDMVPGETEAVQEEPKPKEPAPKQKPKKKQAKPFDVGKAKALREGGWTLAGIAKEMNCSQQTVANHLKKIGMK